LPQNFSRREFARYSLASAGLAAAGPVLGETERGVWKIVTHQRREYVTAESVQAFYRFERFFRDDKDLIYRSPNTIMKWQVGSTVIFINNIKFSLSYPVIEENRKVIISRVDLQKLLDPVLRPWYIKSTEPFHTVTIDAGHGGHDPGARSSHGSEKEFALDMARRLRDEVKKLGLAVHMTRDTDLFLSLPERVRIANKIDKSIFVSVHFNSGTNANASGIETYALAPQGTSSTNDGSVSASKYSGNQSDAQNIALATAVHAMVMTKIEAVDRGIKRARYNVLRGINRPAILFEGGFLTNSKESRLVATASYRNQLAAAVAGGIQNFRKAIG
tara:strand:+ start:4552 stop:5544 length:993 start_codon:yes stop_codon:yes gene_type:complete